MEGFGFWIVCIVAFVILIVFTIIFLASRYKRCPSNQILVLFGKVGEGQSARCIHGGGTLVWPLIQDYAFMNLTPITIGIPLQNALSQQNIRINVPSTFTVGVSTDTAIMTNAAERLLLLHQGQIEEMAKEIIFGQLRLTVASLTIEQINQDRERFLESVRKNVEPELNKIGLYLINVNITDITDESDYIESIGKKAASEAINQARIDVADQNKLGSIGQASADKEKEIKVAEHAAESDKGKKKAESDKRIYVRNQEALAIDGENKSEADMADSNAILAIKTANASQKGEVANREAQVEIQKAQYKFEQERLNAQEVVREETDKRKIEIASEAEAERIRRVERGNADAVLIASEAEAERIRRVAKGNADAVLVNYKAEAEGVKKVLDAKAEGYRELVRSCNEDAKAAATFLMVEKIEEIVARQVEAVKNLKIDKITVWDTANGNASGTTTANFVSGLIKSLPPLHEVAEMAGLELPKFLGDMVDKKTQDEKTRDKDKSKPPPLPPSQPPPEILHR